VIEGTDADLEELDARLDDLREGSREQLADLLEHPDDARGAGEGVMVEGEGHAPTLPGWGE